jgi:acyl-CoA hydrolase
VDQTASGARVLTVPPTGRVVTTISNTYIENRKQVQPNDTNNHGTAHGGNVAKWMDEVGVMSAMRHAGETCVTARINRLDFERPIPRGDVCVIESYAYATGETSIRVRLQAFREDIQAGEREQTTESYFIFVAVDEEMRPTPVPDLEVGSDRCRELRDVALAGEDP